MLGNIRFDMRTKDDFRFYSDKRDVTGSIMAHQPDPSLGFNDRNTGSDVLDMIDRYLDITIVPICGSHLVILVKRYPNETKISQLVSKMRYHHVTVNILSSYDATGGYHPETLYELALKTNGFCAFDNDSDMAEQIKQIPSVFNPYLVYAANPLVSGNEVVILPQMVVAADLYWFAMTIQDNGPLGVVDTALLQWDTSDSLGTINGHYYGKVSGNHAAGWRSVDVYLHNVTVTCNYKDTKTRRLQIRINSPDPVIDHWMPYDN